MRWWENFWLRQRHPVLRSQLITALMAGTVVEVAQVPTAALLDAVLIATAAREYCQAEVVDDYQALLYLAKETIDQPDYTHRATDSIHGNAACLIIYYGLRKFVSAEDLYIPEMIEQYLQQEVPNYFLKETTHHDVRKRQLPDKTPVQTGRSAKSSRSVVQSRAGHGGR